MTLAETVLPRSQAPRAIWIAGASAAILATVWIFQWFGYAPCELCLTQRYAFYAAVPLALLTALLAGRSAHGLARAGFALLALLFVASAALAAYHAGVEYHWWAGPTACTGGLTGSLDVNDLVNTLNSVKVVRCDEVQLRIAGLSLAGWNVVASAVLAAYAAVAARL
ncbi:MAG TPA: disulfide bond formation protein B [Roseiarcus sp.]|jgi:disulfide bond formation protein DsbB|nr:disulfide bond formation protein B [Roseiarcus sp.]